MPFRALLSELVARLPGSRGAIFCDYEGENVDFAVREPPPKGCTPLTDYEIKVAGAQLAAQWIILRQRSELVAVGGPLELKVRTDEGTILCRNVKDGYYLVLLLSPAALTSSAARALEETAARFQTEM